MTGHKYDCEHVLGVGEQKPMGYLPLPYFADFASTAVEEVEAEAARRGIATRRFSQAESQIAGGALYSWAPDPLAAVIEANRDVLEQAGWPTDPAKFVARCAVEWVAGNHPVRSVIAHAFGNAWEIEEICSPAPIIGR
ncbi:hypothetical protein ACVIGB_000567 [Bradyrhizobium sp. USDA 4341]